jgi:hypothetical protein
VISRKTSQISFIAASSVGKCPRARPDRRRARDLDGRDVTRAKAREQL